MKRSLMSFLLVMIVFVGVIFLTGCDKSSSKNPIVGSWALGSYVYTFNEDNTCSYDVSGTIMNCTYEIDGDKLSILYDGNTDPFETTYSIDGNKLNVRDSLGRDTIYEKQ